MAKIRAMDFNDHSDAEIAAFLEAQSTEGMARLKAAIANVETLKAEQAAQAMRDELAAVALKYGVPLQEALTGIKSGGKVLAKYRNPANHAETWTGRGRNPAWVEAWKASHNDDMTGCLIEAPKTVEPAE